MAKLSKTDDKRYVRRQTLWLFSLLALAVGFFSGVMFAVLKAGPDIGPAQARMPAPTGVQPDRSAMMAALEAKTNANPEDAAAWVELGNVYFDSSRLEDAIRAYRKALNLNPDNANTWTDLGVMYRRSGKPGEAIKAFDRAAAVDPRHEVSRMNKGIVLLHDLQDIDGAIAAWEELLAINPIAMAPTGRSVDEMIQQLKKQKKSAGKPGG